MSRGQRSREVERRRVLEAYRSSGLSLRRFGKQMGIPYSTLTRWRQREAKREASRLVSVRVASVETGPADPGVLEVVVGPATVRVGHHFDAGHLARVVAALRSC